MSKTREGVICPQCGKDEFIHTHETAYGMPGTHMAGSERYECLGCNHSLFKSEGEALGLKFVCD